MFISLIICIFYHYNFLQFHNFSILVIIGFKLWIYTHKTIYVFIIFCIYLRMYPLFAFFIFLCSKKFRLYMSHTAQNYMMLYVLNAFFSSFCCLYILTYLFLYFLPFLFVSCFPFCTMMYIFVHLILCILRFFSCCFSILLTFLRFKIFACLVSFMLPIFSHSYRCFPIFLPLQVLCYIIHTYHLIWCSVFFPPHLQHQVFLRPPLFVVRLFFLHILSSLPFICDIRLCEYEFEGSSVFLTFPYLLL